MNDVYLFLGRRGSKLGQLGQHGQHLPPNSSDPSNRDEQSDRSYGVRANMWSRMEVHSRNHPIVTWCPMEIPKSCFVQLDTPSPICGPICIVPETVRVQHTSAHPHAQREHGLVMSKNAAFVRRFTVAQSSHHRTGGCRRGRRGRRGPGQGHVRGVGRMFQAVEDWEATNIVVERHMGTSPTERGDLTQENLGSRRDHSEGV